MKGSLAVSSSRISHCCQIFMQASRPDTPAMPVPLRCCASGRLQLLTEGSGEKNQVVPAQTRKLGTFLEGPKVHTVSTASPNLLRSTATITATKGAGRSEAASPVLGMRARDRLSV